MLPFTYRGLITCGAPICQHLCDTEARHSLAQARMDAARKFRTLLDLAREHHHDAAARARAHSQEVDRRQAVGHGCASGVAK